MTRSRLTAVFVACLLAVSSLAVHADVRADEKTKVEFAGMLGRVVNFFGGKAAREGVTTSRMVRGNRMVSIEGDTAEIVDLDEERVYELNLKKKTYKSTTFAELRQQMLDAEKKAAEQAKNQPDAAPAPKTASGQNEPQMDVDVAVKETGERKTINGFDTHEAIMTITLREKGKTLEEGGGMVVTSDMWLTPTIAAMKELLEFQIRYAQKLAGPVLVGASMDQMSAAMAMYPSMRQALTRMSTEGTKIDGTAIQTVTTIEAVKSADEVAQEQKAKADDQQQSSGGGGLVGGLAGRFARRLSKKNDSSAQSQDASRATVMTTTSEVLKVATAVSADDVAIPAGFKEVQ